VGQASEVEETLKRIRSHRGVEGILIVNNDGVALKSTLSAELTSQYASLFSQVLSVATLGCFRVFPASSL
jgi:dynein light chain roadblock-type